MGNIWSCLSLCVEASSTHFTIVQADLRRLRLLNNGRCCRLVEDVALIEALEVGGQRLGGLRRLMLRGDLLPASTAFSTTSLSASDGRCHRAMLVRVRSCGLAELACRGSLASCNAPISRSKRKFLLRFLPMCSACRRWSILSALFFAIVACAQTSPQTPDLPGNFEAPTVSYDYVKRDVMIPMRDGVKLHTVIVIPQRREERADPPDPHALRRLQTGRRNPRRRTCSPRCRRATRSSSSDGYIRVFQDVRGKYGSEGDYVMTRPLRGPLNSTDDDHSTDAYDTIDWLVKNMPGVERQGRHAGQLV